MAVLARKNSDESNQQPVRQTLILQTEILGINADALSPELRKEFRVLLDNYLDADPVSRPELLQTLRELLDPDQFVDINTISIDDWDSGTRNVEILRKKKEEFGRRLARLMKERSMKAKDLADMLDVTPSCVSQFMSGKHKPQSSTIRRLAEVLGCAEDDLWPPN